MRTVYVNGEYLPEDEATVSIFDRGFLFADAVYEVTSVLDGKLIDFAGHAVRLRRSMDELGMTAVIDADDLLADPPGADRAQRPDRRSDLPAGDAGRGRPGFPLSAGGDAPDGGALHAGEAGPGREPDGRDVA